MDLGLTIRSTKRFLCFLCALASLARHALCCSQDFLDIIGPGLRVRRGPDWDHEKYEDQDHNGIGTVLSEVTRTGWVTVQWDQGKSHIYRVGYRDKCDLAEAGRSQIQCNFYQTNLTNTADFLLSYRDFPRPVSAAYHCFEHIQSPDKNKVVALHVLMIDTCNTTIDSGNFMISGCDMVSGTYVSDGQGHGLRIQMYKEVGLKYGFMAYVTYEKNECPHPTPIFKASKNVSGYINSPYSKYILGSRIICLWEIHSDPDQILELTITYQDDERMVALRENVHSSWKHLTSKKAVHYYTSHTSKVVIRYEKADTYKSRGFQIVYKAKDKAEDKVIKESCPTNKQLEPGDSGILKLPQFTGSIDCQWRLSTKFKSSLIHLTATQFLSSDFPDDRAILKVNGISPWTGSDDKHSFTLSEKSFNISYTKVKPGNSVIILQYRTEKVPFCYEDGSSISVDGHKAFLVVPNASSHITALKEPCVWSLVSPENQRVSLEIISQTEVDWEPYRAFAVHLNGSWKILTGNKFTSEGNHVSLKYSVLGIPKDFSGTLIITYTAVSPLPPLLPTMPLVPVTQTVPQNQSDITPPQHIAECPQQGVPIWCYVVIVLLSIASVTLIIASYILYRRQIYMCDKDRGALYIRYQDMKANEDHT